MERFQKGARFFTVNTQPGKLNTECTENGKLRRPVEKNGIVSFYPMQHPSFFFRLFFLDSQPELPCLEGPSFQVPLSWGITMRNRASQDLFNSFHAVQVSWTCEYFDIHFRWTLRVSFDSALESFTRRCVEWTKKGFSFTLNLRFILESLREKKQLVRGSDSFAYYELNKFREIEIGESDSCVNHTDLSENGYKYWGG